MKKFSYKMFAQHFKNCLKYGDSLRKIAPTVGVSVSTLSRALNGKKMELETALKMADYMNKDIDDYWN